jgi:HPt (histidine-containing phosphotransfer) domain-containing protein
MSLRETTGEGRRKRATAARRPIDFTHLRNQTMGNRDLERKVLRLFLHQITEAIGRIRSAETVEKRSEAAHLLVGSARNVGAFSIAYIAGEIELSKGPVAGRLVALERAAEQARFAIADVLTE